VTCHRFCLEVSCTKCNRNGGPLVKHFIILGLVLTVVSTGQTQEERGRSSRQTRDRPTLRLRTKRSDDGTLAAKWRSSLLKQSISCRLHFPDTAADRSAVVVYLKNLPTPRLGIQDDATLIRGFLKQNMMVIEANYRGDARAIAPQLLPEIDQWYGYLHDSSPYPADSAATAVPEWSRLFRPPARQHRRSICDEI